MVISKIAARTAPVLAFAAVFGLSGCGNMNVDFDGDGVPLAELDMSASAPTGVVLAGADAVVISAGSEFAIDVDGSVEASARMRFARDDGNLVIHREVGDWTSSDGRATIHVTMPAPESLVMAGSGTMTTDAMANHSEIVIAGSGNLQADGIAAKEMDVTIAGSGSLEASGSVARLELDIAGSGSAAMTRLQVDDAEISVAGSGGAEFASDGNVEASIAGSGSVRVRGSASCKSNSVGSGKLICEDA
ncbi:MAG: head GIN domain-containing protein [Alteraurantiacibacter sp.]